MIVYRSDFVGYTIDDPNSKFIIAAGKLTLKDALPAGPYLYRIPGSARVSGLLASLAITGTTLGSTYVFPVLDGRMVHPGGPSGLWVPVPTTTPIASLKNFGTKADSVVLMDVINTALAAGKEHSLGFAILFDYDGVTKPVVEAVELSAPNSPTSKQIHYTRVFGQFPVRTGVIVPKRFKVQLARPTACYDGSPIRVETWVEPNVDTGAWEVYLPDTDSMSNRADAYAFFFDPGTPLLRKVPKAAEVFFGNLPVVNDY